MRMIPTIGLVLVAFLVGTWAGYIVGKHSPCGEVEQTDMWKIPSEDAP